MVLLISLIGALSLPVGVSAQTTTVKGIVAIAGPDGSGAKRPDNSDATVWLTPVSASGKVSETRSGPPAPKLRLVQHHKRFDPHILIVPLGAVVDFPNLDPFFHNVFSLFEGKRFDLGLYEAGTTHSVRFDRPGISYIFCNIHPEMSAVVIVLNTPFYAVSNRAGEFRIPNVPPGRYLVSVWQERSQPDASEKYPREVTISAGNNSLGIIRLVESAHLVAPHKNKYGEDYAPPSPPSPLYDQR